MERFVKLINIKTIHGYYSDVTGMFRFLPTAKTQTLMRDRGILFRQTGDGCQWLIADDCSGFLLNDQLECVLQVRDADFMRVTQLDDYQPQSFYTLSLPEESRTIDVVSALVPANDQMGASCFCCIRIKLTFDMLEDAKCKKPLEYQLRFREAAYRWEYLFVLRNEDADESKSLLLEDTKGRIRFTLPEKRENTPYGEIAWRIVSTSPIVCQQHPDCNLRLSDVSRAELVRLLVEKLNSKGQLTQKRKRAVHAGAFVELPSDVLSEVLSDKSLKKKILSRFIPCPQPGKYKAEQRDCIRQVCYI